MSRSGAHEAVSNDGNHIQCWYECETCGAFINRRNPCGCLTEPADADGHLFVGGIAWDDAGRPYGYENGRCVECGATNGSHYGDCQAVN